MLFLPIPNGLHGDARRRLLGITEPAGRNGREGDAVNALLRSQIQRIAIGQQEQPGGSLRAIARAHCMEHSPDGHAVARRQPGLRHATWVQLAARFQQLRPRCTVQRRLQVIAA